MNMYDDNPTETTPLRRDFGPEAGKPCLLSAHDEEGHAITPKSLSTSSTGTKQWQHETKLIVMDAAPLVLTFFLQYSVDVSSVIAAGRLGTIELGAVSLANMSAIITCFGAFLGLSTSLDTLCAQAYGSGEKHLVGIYCQRVTFFLMCLSIPIALLWYFSLDIFLRILPDPESARLCALYLRWLIPAIPGYGMFEAGKRFLQAQGLFRATTYVLLIATPVHALIMWILIWKLELGFIGAPIAVSITRTLLPILLVLYVVFVDGRQCWGGLSRRAFVNLGSMIYLALPGMIMVLAEWLAFELLTILATRLGTQFLAAQSVMITLTTLSYQIPFPIAIAASTRVANLIGGGKPESAKLTAKLSIFICAAPSALIFFLFAVLRWQIPRIFTTDEVVVELIADTLPLVGTLVFLDGLASSAHGLLRGLGKQMIGGPVNLVTYYALSLPLSIGLALGLHWNLVGLWVGPAVGLVVVIVIELGYLFCLDWQKCVDEAKYRNSLG